MASLQKHVPKMVSGVIDFKSDGQKSCFVSNDIEDLRVRFRAIDQPFAEYYRNYLPEGNVMDYCSFIKLTAAEQFDGQTILLGERLAAENYVASL